METDWAASVIQRAVEWDADPPAPLPGSPLPAHLPQPPSVPAPPGRRPPRDRSVVAPREPRRKRPRDAVQDQLDPLSGSGGAPGDPLLQLPWSRLLNPGLSRSHVATAWRILHGAILVRGLQVHLDPRLPPSAAYCTLPECQRRRHIETISHAFMDCPAARPTMDWLRDMWAAITGQPGPPMDARVLLLDDTRVWSPLAAGALWTHLRTATLHALWHCRSWRMDQVSPAARVVQVLTQAIQRDWARVNPNLQQMAAASGSIPAFMFKGRSPALSLDDFKATWCHRDVLCAVEGDGEGTLSLRLSLLLPVPIPAHPGGAPLGVG